VLTVVHRCAPAPEGGDGVHRWIVGARPAGFERPSGDLPQLRLECAAFDERFDLGLVPDQDPVAVLELFCPAFIVDLGEREHWLAWQQEGSDLLLYMHGDANTCEQLDALCEFARTVYERYLGEHT
jgi:hypothetical protein